MSEKDTTDNAAVKLWSRKLAEDALRELYSQRFLGPQGEVELERRAEHVSMRYKLNIDGMFSAATIRRLETLERAHVALSREAGIDWQPYVSRYQPVEIRIRPVVSRPHPSWGRRGV